MDRTGDRSFTRISGIEGQKRFVDPPNVLNLLFGTTLHESGNNGAFFPYIVSGLSPLASVLSLTKIFMVAVGERG